MWGSHRPTTQPRGNINYSPDTAKTDAFRPITYKNTVGFYCFFLSRPWLKCVLFDNKQILIDIFPENQTSQVNIYLTGPEIESNLFSKWVSFSTLILWLIVEPRFGYLKCLNACLYARSKSSGALEGWSVLKKFSNQRPKFTQDLKIPTRHI